MRYQLFNRIRDTTSYEGHIHQRAAKNWFDPLGASARLFFCRFTQLGLLRLLTAEAVMGQEEVMSQAEAWGAYDRWLADERVGFLEEPAGLEPTFRAMTRLRHAAPKDWADSYLAAFALNFGLALVTFDRALQSKARQTLLLKP